MPCMHSRSKSGLSTVRTDRWPLASASCPAAVGQSRDQTNTDILSGDRVKVSAGQENEFVAKVNVQIRLPHHKRAEWRATLHPSYAAGGICSRNCSAACMQQSVNTARLQPLWRNCCWIRLHIRAAPQEQRGRLTTHISLSYSNTFTHTL